jgi:hypothetical protein
MPRLVVASTLILLCSVAALDVHAADPLRRPVDPTDLNWGWFAAVSVINDWSVRTGRAKVVITGSSLVAELYDPRDNALTITLKGTTKGNQVDVVAVQHSTDAEPQRLTGTHKKMRWKNVAGGRESILLTEAGQPWGLSIGLTREIK